MARLIDRLLPARDHDRSWSQISMSDWSHLMANQFSFDGLQYILGAQTYSPRGDEGPALSGCASYTSNGVGFAVVNRRVSLFAQARFKWKRLSVGVKPMASDLFGLPSLAPLDDPVELLTWMELDVANAGNAYVVRVGDRLRRLNPFWCTIIGNSARFPERASTAWDADPVGLMYLAPGRPDDEAEVWPWDEVAHYAPYKDPDARWRGMSYLRPVVAEVHNTNAFNTFVSRYWANNATPNMVVTFPPDVILEKIRAFRDAFLEKHSGVERAFRPAFLGGGADLKMVGANLADLGAKDVMSDAFAKICAAAGVPPIVVTIVPGLESASTYANYATALRSFSDLTIRPLWLNATLALRKLIPPPADAELWYDVSGVSALQADALDDAAVLAQQATTMRQLVDGGFDPSSVLAAVTTGDMTKLRHSGNLSVQLIPAGQLPAGGDQ